MDSDVIQQYFSLELGLGIIAAMASEHTWQNGLQTIVVGHLFASNVTQLAARRLFTVLYVGFYCAVCATVEADGYCGGVAGGVAVKGRAG